MAAGQMQGSSSAGDPLAHAPRQRTVRRWAGGFGVAGFVVFLAALPLYSVGTGSVAQLQDTAQYSDFITKTNTLVLIRTTLTDPLIMICLVVFVAGFRQLVRQARQDYEWIATLVFGAGLIVVALELVGDGLQAGAALDTWVRADPTAVRALNEASFPIYGAIGLIISSLLLASAGYAIRATGVLHGWTAWFAFGAAIVNLGVAPSILGGTDITGFYTASGYAPLLGEAAMLIWFLMASVSMILKREATPS